MKQGKCTEGKIKSITVWFRQASFVPDPVKSIWDCQHTPKVTSKWVREDD